MVFFKAGMFNTNSLGVGAEGVDIMCGHYQVELDKSVKHLKLLEVSNLFLISQNTNMVLAKCK